jgi:hypothetical protein
MVDGFVRAGTMMLDAGFFPQANADGIDFDFTSDQSELWLAFRWGEEAAAAFN